MTGGGFSGAAGNAGRNPPGQPGRQFLVEAAVLTTSGGLVGVAVGYGLSSAISTWAEWPVTFTPIGAILGMLVSSASGFIFGLWPAWQAAKVNSIEALRSG